MVALVLTTACERETAPTGVEIQAHRSGHERRDGTGPYGVGHTTIQFVHVGNAGEARPVDVHAWYPASRLSFGPRTHYTSRLAGKTLVPGTYDPLTYTIPSAHARENVHVAFLGPRFPLLLWSHGSSNDALDNTTTLEAIASHGYVIAAPQHTGNSQDDVLTDFVNTTAGAAVLPCLDGLAPPCSGGALGPDVRNRARDISALIDEMGSLNHSRFHGRIDLTRIGMMGHSRGVMTALASVAGNAANSIPIEPRIAAILTTAAGAMAFDPAAMAQVKIPVVMFAGAADQNSTLPVVRAFFDQLTGAPRTFVVLRNGPHRAFNSGVCARMQAASAVRQANPRALLEERIANQLLVSPANGSSLDYCVRDDFLEPVDVTAFASSVTGVDVSQTTIPSMLAADEVSDLVVPTALAFFGAALHRHPSHGYRVPLALTPKVLQREPIVESAETILTGDAKCVPGFGCTGP